MVRQPAFAALAPGAFRIAGTLDNTDYVMNNAFFLGTYPGLTPAMLAVTADRFREFMAKH
jgi:CDP-6-deoxy-D-xylo-4-hexulose-3-dehydrase